MGSPVRWVANLSMLFTELPLPERPAAAAAAGFSEVEMWWPFDGDPRPTAEQVDTLVAVVERAGVRLTAMNLFDGSASTGDRGVAAHPDRAGDFQDALEVAMGVARRLGTRLFNVPYGRRLDGVPEEDQAEAALAALQSAARAAHEVGGSILIEPMSGMDDYPISTTAQGLQVVGQVRRAAPSGSVGLLLDTFHVLSVGDDLQAAVAAAGPDLRHVQISDVPGRGEPGSGSADLRGFVHGLDASGYAGAVALEWIPTTSTTRSLERWREAFGLR